jgi:hypothetical protein
VPNDAVRQQQRAGQGAGSGPYRSLRSLMLPSRSNRISEILSLLPSKIRSMLPAPLVPPPVREHQRAGGQKRSLPALPAFCANSARPGDIPRSGQSSKQP